MTVWMLVIIAWSTGNYASGGTVLPHEFATVEECKAAVTNSVGAGSTNGGLTRVAWTYCVPVVKR